MRLIHRSQHEFFNEFCLTLLSLIVILQIGK